MVPMSAPSESVLDPERIPHSGNSQSREKTRRPKPSRIILFGRLDLLAQELDRRAWRRFVGTRLVDGRLGRALTGSDKLIGQQKGLDLLAAHIGQHAPIDLHAGAEHLTALFNHLLALRRVVDDVAVFVWQIVFPENGAHAIAPAARGFQIGDNFRFIHSSKVMNKVT